MAELLVQTYKERCRAFGQCVKIAPAVFALDEDRKVVAATKAAAPELLLKAAKACPYRAIALVDDATGEQVFPVRHR